MIRTALIGFGLAGEHLHAPYLTAPDYQLVAVQSSRPEAVANRYPDVPVYSSLEALLAAETVELVVIATPNAEHYPLAKTALLAGCHVLVEKPFTVTLTEAEQLTNLARQQNRLLTVYHNRRYTKDFRTLLELVQADELGVVQTFEAHYDRYRPTVRARWREQDVPGAGLLYDLGSHLIDQALMLFGERPDRVFCDQTIQRPDGPVEDYTHLILTFGTRRAVLHIGSLVPAPGPSLAVHGTKASYFVDSVDTKRSTYTWGRPEQPLEERPFVDSGFADYYHELAQALRHESPLAVTTEQALLVMKIIDCAQKSVKEGTWIEVE
ncbi:Gfo/Idh/MocA family oxidoreductase [Exiguobacterium artemiae]|uniref:Gfo/Idh/MocA family oxidoreductase n=1 Tax=Exiguobacterium artemiae TaxID=340145 RepID=UPI003D01D114